MGEEVEGIRRPDDIGAEREHDGDRDHTRQGKPKQPSIALTRSESGAHAVAPETTGRTQYSVRDPSAQTRTEDVRSCERKAPPRTHRPAEP